MAISFWKYTEYTLPVPKQINRAFCGGAQGVYLFFSKKDSLLVFCFTKKQQLYSDYLYYHQIYETGGLLWKI